MIEQQIKRFDEQGDSERLPVGKKRRAQVALGCGEKPEDSKRTDFRVWRACQPDQRLEETIASW
jgi:hypothetical protein